MQIVVFFSENVARVPFMLSISSRLRYCVSLSCNPPRKCRSVRQSSLLFQMDAKTLDSCYLRPNGPISVYQDKLGTTSRSSDRIGLRKGKHARKRSTVSLKELKTALFFQTTTRQNLLRRLSD